MYTLDLIIYEDNPSSLTCSLRDWYNFDYRTEYCQYELGQKSESWN